MGLLQGPSLMAWTTESPIRGSPWVRWGGSAHHVSVKNSEVIYFFVATFPTHIFEILLECDSQCDKYSVQMTSFITLYSRIIAQP